MGNDPSTLCLSRDKNVETNKLALDNLPSIEKIKNRKHDGPKSEFDQSFMSRYINKLETLSNNESLERKCVLSII